MTTNLKQKERLTNRRAVAPVIATLLMVAIAVVGGTIIFVFSQGFFSQSQISGNPSIESVKILGYDARDISALRSHDGTTMPALSASNATNGALGKNVDERVAIFIKNDSVSQILFSEVRLGGTVYSYATAATLPDWDDSTDIVPGTYAIMQGSAATAILQEQAATVQPGETATVLVDLNNNFPIGRDTQFKLTTTNGAVFVGTIVMGQNAG
ncbi:MAG: archaellin/type IV pilin N-terminal domain-containing protein [Nitrosopumilaceae archaeon]